jgi:hypothetical protein
VELTPGDQYVYVIPLRQTTSPDGRSRRLANSSNGHLLLADQLPFAPDDRRPTAARVGDRCRQQTTVWPIILTTRQTGSTGARSHLDIASIASGAGAGASLDRRDGLAVIPQTILLIFVNRIPFNWRDSDSPRTRREQTITDDITIPRVVVWFPGNWRERK